MQPTLHCACFDHARETYGDRETRVDVVDINGEMLRDSQTYHNSAHAFLCFLVLAVLSRYSATDRIPGSKRLGTAR